MLRSDSRGDGQMRTYQRATCIVFLRTHEPFGGLSNMAGGFPLRVNGTKILTAEALYQACRFPHLPDVQRLIIDQRSPMTAKMISKPHRNNSRPDWDDVRVKVMRWSLRVKLAQNWRAFSELLLETRDHAIVEESRKDSFWGANPISDSTLVGMNVLGRLLMELRERIKNESRESLLSVDPVNIPNFLIVGQPISRVSKEGVSVPATGDLVPVAFVRHSDESRTGIQPSLFDLAPERASVPYSNRVLSDGPLRIANLGTYSDYKESCQSWLGVIPRHWAVRPNRALFSEVKERSYPDEQMLSVTIASGIVRQEALLEGSSKKDSSNLDKSAYKLVRPGDIAYNKMRAWQGALGVSTFRGIVSPAYVVMRARDKHNSASYFHHLFRSPHFAKEAERWSYGITSDMWSLRPEHFKMIYTPVPPPDEQAAIVRFLDWANGRLERTILAKRKVIALLNEQKQAIIHRAVTRGLDPNVALKPSGIPWIGDVPQHWDVVRAKYLYREVDSRSKEGNEELLSVSHLTGVTPRSQKNITMFKAESYAGHKMCKPGDLVINTMWAWMGALGTSTHAGIISPAYAVYRPRQPKAVIGKYMDGLLRSRPYVSNMICRSTGLTASRLRLYPEEFFRLPIIQPPAEEQQQIVDSIQRETAELDHAFSRLEREIELLSEYRTRLVADVVTGKLDVRQAAAKLPESNTNSDAPELAVAIDEFEPDEVEIE